MNEIYLDYAATTPLRPGVRQLVTELLEQPLGNASSLHRRGRNARLHLETAREQCASALSAKVEEIVFTSGATEANNLALWGVMTQAPAGSRLLYSAIEHPAIRNYAHSLGCQGFQIEEIPVTPDGQVDPQQVLDTLDSQVTLVSIMAANNEIGTLQPLEPIVAECRRRGITMHVDAVQYPTAADLKPDLVSISGHKLGGLPGGLLYIRQGLRIRPMLVGGAQEDSRRAGTTAVISATVLGHVLERYQRGGAQERRQVAALREHFEVELNGLPGARLIAGHVPRAEHISAWIFDGIPAEPLLARLDMNGICASSGAACSSHSIEPSHVLLAMGLSETEALALIRFSLGWNTDKAGLDRAVEVLTHLVKEMMVSA